MSTSEKYGHILHTNPDYVPPALPLQEVASSIRKIVGMANACEMAATIGVSEETLATWRAKKRGPPHIKIGKKVFYLISDLEQWVIEERVKQTGYKRSKRREYRETSVANATSEWSGT